MSNKTPLIDKIDKGLANYYKRLDRYDDYINSLGIGKFKQYIESNNLSEEEVREELNETNAMDCSLCHFDRNAQNKNAFPLKPPIYNTTEKIEKIFQILKEIQKNGSYKADMIVDDEKTQHSKKKKTLSKWFSKLGKKQKNANYLIDEKMKEHKNTNSKTLRLLLLGPGHAGKSTVLRQLTKIYGNLDQNKVPDKIMLMEITQNILLNITYLAQQNIKLQKSNAECELSIKTQKICQYFASLNPYEQANITQQLASDILLLWKDKGMQETYNKSKKSIIIDNAAYFFNNMNRILMRCTFEDYLRIRNSTRGIINSQLAIDNGWKLSVTDVGGQRSERRKWLMTFNDLDLLVYVMSLSGYDQTLFEENSTNCYCEALQLFEKTVNNRALQNVDKIVFLNKNDLFMEKIKRVPFSVFDPNFDKNKVNDGDAVKKYLIQQLTKKSKQPIAVHVTCATDTDQIQAVMRYVVTESTKKIMRKNVLM